MAYFRDPCAAFLESSRLVANHRQTALLQHGFARVVPGGAASADPARAQLLESEIDGGPWAGRKCIGCSLAFDAAGREILQGAYGEDGESLMLVDVVPAPRPARGTGWDSYPSGRARQDGVRGG